MSLNRISILLIIVLLTGCFICACGKENSESHVENTEKETAEQWAEGYDLPMDEREEKEAENDCSTMMELIKGIYEHAYRGEASNVVLDDETVLKMQNKLKETGWPISTTAAYSNMENYKSVDSFLNECMEGENLVVVTMRLLFLGLLCRRSSISKKMKMGRLH